MLNNGKVPRAETPFAHINIESGLLTEGKATITFPKGEVFYNPVQQFNRDLTILVLETFSKVYLDGKPSRTGLTILEALSATGLRAVRYARELSNVEKIVANDLDLNAVKLIESNIALNGREDPGVINKLIANQGDAISAMHKLKSDGHIFDVIDLDPYGSASPFIDAAVQNIADGGLLCVTCTDLAVLCASYPETCFAKYGGLPIKGDSCHEGALRLVLNALETSANRYKRHVVPLMSCSIDFYVRLFVRVYESPKEVKMSCTKRGQIARCVQCRSIKCTPFLVEEKGRFMPSKNLTVGQCELCDSRVEILGPMWLAPIHDPQFINLTKTSLGSMNHYFGTKDRIEGLLSVASEELPICLFSSLTEMASFLKLGVPKLSSYRYTSSIPSAGLRILCRSAILNAGFEVSGSHCSPLAVKTNAPALLSWKILLESTRPHRTYDEGSPQQQLITKCLDSPTEIDFSHHKDSEPPSKVLKLKRFPENPTRNWGPLARAKKNRDATDIIE